MLVKHLLGFLPLWQNWKKQFASFLGKKIISVQYSEQDELYTTILDSDFDISRVMQRTVFDYLKYNERLCRDF